MKKTKEKSLEEIYKEARQREGPVIIPPQINSEYLKSLEKITKIEKFGELLKEFNEYQKLANENPGNIVAGNMILGAPASEYYQPSEEEKCLSEIGKRIGSILNSIKDQKSVKAIINSMINNSTFIDLVNFKEIRFYHIDVVGSGRFIYPDVTGDVSFSILDQFNKVLIKKGIKDFITKIKTNFNNPNKSVQEKKDLFKNLLNLIK